MKLRHKLNLIAVGYCGFGALVMAVCGKLGMSMMLAFLAWWNWTVALSSENAVSTDKRDD